MCMSQSAPDTISKGKYKILLVIKLTKYFITEWSKQACPVVITPCTEQAGPRVPLPQDPLGLFSLFFDENLVSLIVNETNRYA